MRLGGIVGLLAMATAACGLLSVGPPGWVGDGVHVVDGYWLGPEQPCIGHQMCDAALAEARRMGLDGSTPDLTIAAARLAMPPDTWRTEDGTTMPVRTLGLSWRMFLVVDLADGRQRALPLVCKGPMYSGDGRLLEPAECYEAPPAAVRDFRVGGPPPAIAR